MHQAKIKAMKKEHFAINNRIVRNLLLHHLHLLERTD